MSRSALWRQEAGKKERERYADEVFQVAVEEGKQRSQKGLIPLTNDETFNFNSMLLQNISKSPYFQKCCTKLQDWTTLVDEIYYEVNHMEPWTQGHVKNPSTAFCLLLRLFTLRCSEKQMTLMLDHPDSPYIRCIGFLYLRYASEPTQVWGWFQPYLYDEEPVRISSRMNNPEITVGEYVRSLLTDMDYFGTLFPRLPVAVERDVKVKLLQEEIVEERAVRNFTDEKRLRYFETIGNRVRALYGDEENPETWYDAVVDRVLRRDDETGVEFVRPKFLVTFPEYGNTEVVALGELDMPNNNQKRSSYDSKSNHSRNSYQSHAARDASNLEGQHSDDRGHDQRGHRYGNGRDRYHHDDHGQSSSWAHDRHLDSHHDRNRSRSRSRDRGIPASSSRHFPNDANLMEEVRRREREKIAAKGKSYATRPATFKQSMSVKTDGETGMNDTHYHHYHHSERPKHTSSNDNTKSRQREGEKGHDDSLPIKQKTPEELAAIAEKKRKLMAKYG